MMRKLKAATFAKIERLPRIKTYARMSATELQKSKPITRKAFAKYGVEFHRTFRASADFVPDFTRTITDPSVSDKKRLPVRRSFDPVREFAEVKFYEGKLQDDLYAKKHLKDVQKKDVENAKNELKKCLKENAKKLESILEYADIKKSPFGAAGNYKKIKKHLLQKEPTLDGIKMPVIIYEEVKHLGLSDLFASDTNYKAEKHKLNYAASQEKGASNDLFSFRQENQSRLKRADYMLNYYRGNFTARAKAFAHRAKREIGLATVKSTITRPGRELLALIRHQKTQESEIDKIVKNLTKPPKPKTLIAGKPYIQ